MPYDPFSRARIVLALESAGGAVLDRRGKATALLGARLGGVYPGLTALLAQMQSDGEVSRDVNGKRCYGIRLCVPTPKTARQLGLLREQLGVPVDEPVEDAPVEPALVEEPTAPVAPVETIDVVLAWVEEQRGASARMASMEAWILELERQLTEQSPSDELVRLRTEHSEMSQRLAMVLEENTRIRIRLRDAGDELRASSTRIAGLNREKADLQNNLRAALQASKNIVDAEVRRELDRVMRQAPGSSKGDD